MEPEKVKRITKNILVSIFIYALPIVLMFISFYINGERPWENYDKTQVYKSKK